MMQNEMIHTSRVLIVEGKYDAARLAHLTDAMILLTEGVGIYKDKKRQQLFKALAQKNGLILLTDSYAARFRIRIRQQDQTVFLRQRFEQLLALFDYVNA